jgi:glycosyltransferase involved in cell wall biosynthesis
VDVLIIENALAIPMHVPLGLAIADFIAETSIPTIAHGHDFAWERERFRLNCVQGILDHAFPPNLPSVRHAVINSPAARALKERLGVEPVVVPNVMDYATPPPQPSWDKEAFRRSIGIEPGEVMLLQPTRVVPRKGIELAIELAQKLRDAHGIRASLVVTHKAGDEGMEYYGRLVGLAQEKGVPLLYVADEMDEASTWDAYHHADFVTYPSLYEGFGNALLETVYFKKPALVNRYGVYAADIGSLGFDFVEIDGAVTDRAVLEVCRLLEDPLRREAAVEKNYGLARRHFSYEVLEGCIKALLEDF